MRNQITQTNAKAVNGKLKGARTPLDTLDVDSRATIARGKSEESPRVTAVAVVGASKKHFVNVCLCGASKRAREKLAHCGKHHLTHGMQLRAVGERVQVEDNVNVVLVVSEFEWVCVWPRLSTCVCVCVCLCTYIGIHMSVCNVWLSSSCSKGYDQKKEESQTKFAHHKSLSIFPASSHFSKSLSK